MLDKTGTLFSHLKSDDKPYAAGGLRDFFLYRDLGIAEATVKSHLAAVYAVLGVRNRTEAAYHASREGIRVG